MGLVPPYLFKISHVVLNTPRGVRGSNVISPLVGYVSMYDFDSGGMDSTSERIRDTKFAELAIRNAETEPTRKRH